MIYYNLLDAINKTMKSNGQKIARVYHLSINMLHPHILKLSFFIYISREEKKALKKVGADFAEHYVLHFFIMFFGNE